MSVAADCGSPVFSAVNATGSVEFPGFVFGQSKPPTENNTWTISTAIAESLLPMTNTTKTQQDFWLNTNPLVTSNLTDLPYWGCVFLLQDFKQEPISNGTDGSTSCNGVFDSGCYNAITSVATSTAWLLDDNAASIVQVCQDIGKELISPIPWQCKKSPWSSLLQAIPFGDVGSTGTSCNNSVFNGSATQAPLLSLDSRMSHPGNFTDYDSWVRHASPVLMTVFKKSFSGDQSPRWADSRLVCLTAKSITTGSRVPTSGAAPWSAGSMTSSMLMAVVWAVWCLRFEWS